jgi:hypothetical protein
MKSLKLKDIVDEIIQEELEKQNEVNWKGLAAAGMIGFAGLHPAGQQVLAKVKQSWNQAVQNKQAMNQQAAQQTHFQNPNEELPSEKDMGGWDLANKYTNRNVSLAQKLKPAVDSYMKEGIFKNTEGNQFRLVEN